MAELSLVLTFWTFSEDFHQKSIFLIGAILSPKSTGQYLETVLVIMPGGRIVPLGGRGCGCDKMATMHVTVPMIKNYLFTISVIAEVGKPYTVVKEL